MVNEKYGEMSSKFAVNSQYSNSSDTSEIDPRISPRHTRAGSICAAMILRTIAFSEVGPQPRQKNKLTP